ncbi:MAG: dTDP-4-dehydrorhamnose 3,5-epimerase [Sedimenticola sp.]
MRIAETGMSGVYVIEHTYHKDLRGEFFKVFNSALFREAGLVTDFREAFHSTSVKNVIRGMHFQVPPHDHEKLVYASQGCVLDVVIDIRPDSSTYGRYFATELSAENRKSIYIARGFAHGFRVLSDSATVHYMTSTEHHAQSDRGILWNSFGCDWRLKGGDDDPVLSDRDRSFPGLENFDSPF